MYNRLIATGNHWKSTETINTSTTIHENKWICLKRSSNGNEHNTDQQGGDDDRYNDAVTGGGGTGTCDCAGDLNHQYPPLP